MIRVCSVYSRFIVVAEILYPSPSPMEKKTGIVIFYSAFALLALIIIIIIPFVRKVVTLQKLLKTFSKLNQSDADRLDPLTGFTIPVKQPSSN